ncbi:MAG: hypothetical protein MJE12_28915 [Alphaproteobacteria bacterium]|nr:hypothetical protein [Alphaproteobacteria bacterium]
MSFRVIPFEASHIDDIELQPAQSALRTYLAAGHGPELSERSIAYTAVDDRVIACAGVIPVWPGRDCAWALLSDCGPTVFWRVHRAVKRFLDARLTRRIEMIVDPDHRAACRWARLLGFEEEGYMKSYSPDGRDALMFARIRDERR